MFEWSKELSDKISKSGCVTEQEMQYVEMGLRLMEIHDSMMNESIGVKDECAGLFELKYQLHKNAKNKNDTGENK